ncbi:MAG: hypothetical protein QXK74_04965 [Candidatus Nitrosocaldaceae archaeon]
MHIHFFPIVINKITIIGISISLYLYFIYTFFPTYLYDPLTLFILTIGVTSYILLTKIKKTNTHQIAVQQNIISDSQNNDTKLQDVTPQTSVAIDESLIQTIIEQKLSTFITEFNKTKQQLDDSLNMIKSTRGEIDELKKITSELKSAFDTTLVDLKAFQTEISNPLNFMRKYFESIDIKSFSDPLLPLQNEKINNVKVEANINDTKQGIKKIDNIDEVKRDNSEVNKIVNELNDVASNSNISLTEIMNLILNIGESIDVFGNYYHDVLITQSKILGLNKEQLELLYSITDILTKSKRSANEYVISLYKLANSMGIKDENMDRIYAKLKKDKRAR